MVKNHKLINPDTMTKDEIFAEIQKGIDDMENGRTIPVERVWAEVEKVRAERLRSPNIRPSVARYS